MVIAIGAFTTLTVGSYIHDSQTGQALPISKQWTTAVHRIEAWVEAHEQPGTPVAVQPQALSPVVDVHSAARTSGSMLTKQDDQRLLDIAKSLSTNMSASDWSQVIEWLNHDSPATAQANLVKLLKGKLSHADIQWLQAHFQGSQAFNREDVTLLEKTVKEVQQLLTPDEQALLRKQLAQLGVNIGG